MRLVKLEKSTRPEKKWMATFCDCEGGTKCKPSERRVVHFGASGYEDYTMHKDKDRRRLYRIRHAKEKDQKPDTPGALSYHLLWGDSTSLQKNLAAYKKKIAC
jgi:hypothetical protein